MARKGSGKDVRVEVARWLESAAFPSPSSMLLGAGGLVACIALALFTPATLSQAILHGWFADAAGIWSLPVAVVAFALFAFLGVPQIALIAAAILAFGPGWGAVDSWVGTFISALVGFWLGRRLGAGVLSRRRGAWAAAILDGVGRNGFLASLLVRLVPAAPFLGVNMIAGALPIGALDYAAGTAIGIVPKIALIALADGSLLSLRTGHAAPLAIALLAAAAIAWLGIGVGAFFWLRRNRPAVAAAPAPAE